MALLFISVWGGAGEVAMGDVLQEEVVAVGGGSLQSNIITGSGVRQRVRLYSDTDCFVTWGNNPTGPDLHGLMGGHTRRTHRGQGDRAL